VWWPWNKKSSETRRYSENLANSAPSEFSKPGRSHEKSDWVPRKSGGAHRNPVGFAEIQRIQPLANFFFAPVIKSLVGAGAVAFVRSSSRAGGAAGVRRICGWRWRMGAGVAAAADGRGHEFEET
jgi:hypothetical protein